MMEKTQVGPCEKCLRPDSGFAWLDCQDGLGRTWDEWHCAACDHNWEDNVRIEPGSYFDRKSNEWNGNYAARTI